MAPEETQFNTSALLSPQAGAASAIDPLKLGEPDKTILASERKGLIVALGLGYPENSVGSRIIDGHGAVVVEDKSAGLGKDCIPKRILRSHGSRTS
jgi:hypothetical protein